MCVRVHACVCVCVRVRMYVMLPPSRKALVAMMQAQQLVN